MMIALDDYPFPPQSNNIYRDKMIRMKGPGGKPMWVPRGRAKSEEYREYELAVAAWSAQRKELLARARSILATTLIIPNALIRIDSVYCVPRYAEGESRIAAFAKPKSKSRPAEQRIWDTMNRLKAQFDTLASVLSIPDHRFIPGLATKAILEDDGEPCVTMKLTVERIKTRSEMLEELGLV